MSDFIEKYYSDETIEIKECLTGYYEKFLSIIANKPYSKLEANDLTSFWEHGKVARSSFFLIKKLILNYGEEYNLSNTTMENMTYEYVYKECDTSHYFKDEKDLDDSILQAASKFGMGDENDMLQLRSMCLLFWHGYSSYQIAEMKKTDVDVIEVSEYTRSVLKKYRDVVKYKAFPSGRICALMNSSYLFRGTKCENLTTIGIADVVRRFNKQADKFGLQIDARRLSRNGKFELIYKLEQETGDLDYAIEKIIKLTSSSYMPKSYLLPQYRKWKRENKTS